MHSVTPKRGMKLNSVMQRESREMKAFMSSFIINIRKSKTKKVSHCFFATSPWLANIRHSKILIHGNLGKESRQGAKTTPSNQIHPLSAFVNSFIEAQLCLLIYVLASSTVQGWMVVTETIDPKVENIYCLALYRKMMATPGLGSQRSSVNL